MNAHANLLDGRFELLVRLPDQGHGEVWKARDTQLRDRLVAVKLLRPEVSPSDAALASTLRRLKSFRHGAVLALLHHGAADGRVYLVYELFEGPSLAAGLAQTWREGALLPRAMLERLVEKLCAAVEAAHALRPPLAHGGLDPACVLLQRSSPTHFDLRITDFGVAAFAGAPSDGEPTSVAADVAGLGRVMRALFAAPAGAGQAPPPAGQDWRRDDLPDELWAVVERATAPRPGEHFADIESLMRALETAWKCPVKGPAARPGAAVAGRAEAQPAAAEPVGELDGATEVVLAPRSRARAVAVTPQTVAAGAGEDEATTFTPRTAEALPPVPERERTGIVATAWAAEAPAAPLDDATVFAMQKGPAPSAAQRPRTGLVSTVWGAEPAAAPADEGTMLAMHQRAGGYVPAQGDTMFAMPGGTEGASAGVASETIVVSAAEMPRSPWDAPGLTIEKTEVVGRGTAGGLVQRGPQTLAMGASNPWAPAVQPREGPAPGGLRTVEGSSSRVWRVVVALAVGVVVGVVAVLLAR